MKGGNFMTLEDIVAGTLTEAVQPLESREKQYRRLTEELLALARIERQSVFAALRSTEAAGEPDIVAVLPISTKDMHGGLGVADAFYTIGQRGYTGYFFTGETKQVVTDRIQQGVPLDDILEGLKGPDRGVTVTAPERGMLQQTYQENMGRNFAEAAWVRAVSIAQNGGVQTAVERGITASLRNVWNAKAAESTNRLFQAAAMVRQPQSAEPTTRINFFD